MRSIVKVSIFSGMILGAVLGITVSLLLDFMTGGALGGGWYEAVRHDMGSLLGSQWTEKQWLIYSGIVIVIAIISILGAMIGALFGFIVGKILSIMTS